MPFAKRLLYACTALMLAAAVIRSAQPVDAVELAPGDLIRGNFATVYYYGADGGRYSFPNSQTYFTWFDDFSGVRTISEAELGAIPLYGNVTYKPGTRLLKLQSAPETYAVERGGLLRHLPSENFAEQLYGNDWQELVDDLADSFFPYYTLGDPLQEYEEHDPEEISSFARTINVDKSLQAGSYDVPAVPELYDPGTSAGTGNAFTISWEEVDNARVYKLEKDSDLNFSNPTIEYVGSETETSDSITTSDSIVYYYRVKAINAAGQSNWSETQGMAIIVTSAPGRVIMNDPGSSFVSGTTFSLTWISETENVAFEVQRDDNVSFTDPTQIYSGTGTRTSVRFTHTEDTTYYFRVRARNSVGYSLWSTPVDITIRGVDD